MILNFLITTLSSPVTIAKNISNGKESEDWFRKQFTQVKNLMVSLTIIFNSTDLLWKKLCFCLQEQLQVHSQSWQIKRSILKVCMSINCSEVGLFRMLSLMTMFQFMTTCPSLWDRLIKIKSILCWLKRLLPKPVGTMKIFPRRQSKS